MNHTVQHDTTWLLDRIHFQVIEILTTQMRDADSDLLHGSWCSNKSNGFSFKPIESGNPLHQCLVHVSFSSSLFNIPIICGPPINQATSQSAFHVTTFPSWSQPSIWEFPTIFMFKRFLHSTELCQDYFLWWRCKFWCLSQSIQQQNFHTSQWK